MGVCQDTVPGDVWGPCEAQCPEGCPWLLASSNMHVLMSRMITKEQGGLIRRRKNILQVRHETITSELSQVPGIPSKHSWWSCKGAHAHPHLGMTSSAIRQNILKTFPPLCHRHPLCGSEVELGQDKSQGLAGSRANPQLVVPAPREHCLNIKETRTCCKW